MYRRHTQHGHLTVIVGCMFSGKSDILSSRLANAQEIARVSVMAFGPLRDTRTESGFIVSRTGRKFPAQYVAGAPDILAAVTHDTRIVGIDEAQFFDYTVVAVAEQLVARGIDVIVSGLDTNFLGEPFNYVPQLLAVSDEFLRTYAVCDFRLRDGSVCAGRAMRTQFTSEAIASDPNSPESVGDSDKYAARCRDHFVLPPVHRAGGE
jgi:thymidine kinase